MSEVVGAAHVGRIGRLRRCRAVTPAIAAMIAALASIGPVAAAADDAAQLARGKALFTGGTQPPCGLCHTLKDAGTAGAIGPVLDELQPDAARVATAVKSGIGAMPSFRATLSEDDIQAISRYVAQASRGAP